MSRRFTSSAAALLAASALAACSSSSGAGVSLGSLESKLKKEPAIQSVLNQGGTKAKLTSQLVDCIAKALDKNANQSDLKKYVSGKLDLNDIGGKSKGSANGAENDAKTCAQQTVAKDKSSAPSN